MLFNSLEFAVFFPIVFALYWILPHKYRCIFLFFASYWFYMSWNPKYVVLILFTTFVSYVAGISLEMQESVVKKRIVLAITCAVCLGVLFFFKYFNFVFYSLAKIAMLLEIHIDPIVLKLLLPVGISFYTFQTLSYVIDVYRGTVRAERNFFIYATFISFFPQLVAGPIERTGKLLPQIKEEHTFDYYQASYGVKQMAWGFFKKIAIADTISLYIGSVFDNPYKYQGFVFALAMFLFAIQIYCDFSGYSDIAIGTAKLMGISLTKNFDSPYYSTSIKEFWNRWHISLSTWLRDYVYIPLGGNRVGRLRNAFNLLVTFLISGLWHGADWTFVIWGGIHGIALVIENFFINRYRMRKRKGLFRVFKILIVFCFCSFAWIFFASNAVRDAFYILNHMLDGIIVPSTYVMEGFQALGLELYDFALLMISIVLLAVYDYISLNTDVIKWVSKRKKLTRWSIYVLFLIWMMICTPVSNQSTFIYFQF